MSATPGTLVETITTVALSAAPLTVAVHRGHDGIRAAEKTANPAPHAAWLATFQEALGHKTLFVQAHRGKTTVGTLPLSLVQSALFGRFLVSLPYVNSAGVSATDGEVARLLIDRAVELANELDVRYL